MKQSAAGTVTLVVLSQAVHFLTFGGIALLLPLIREDLGISFSQGGLLSAAVLLSYAATQIPAGYLCDRFGAKRLFLAGMLGWSVLALALSASVNYILTLLILFVAGLFRAFLFSPGLTLVASWFPANRRATAMSIFLIGSSLGIVCLALSGPALSAWLGWRATFAAYAFLGLPLAAGFWLLASDKPRPEHAARVNLRDVQTILTSRIIWVCNAMQFIRFSVMTAVSFWLPSLLLADHGFMLQTAGLIVAFSTAIAGAANPLGGYVSDRIRNPPLVIGGSLAILACTTALLSTVHSVPLLLTAIALTSMFMSIYFGPLFFVPIEVLGARTAGLVTGIGNLFANLGALTAAYGLGIVKDVTGNFSRGYLAISGLCVAGVLLSVVLARFRRTALVAASHVRPVHVPPVLEQSALLSPAHKP